ncbi:MAG: mechanosensitive ion channel family protein [Deltaproteobacteria bacterium]|nr:mechanosensitive ion channel family protein [Deltaproteobacteria bacterium]
MDVLKDFLDYSLAGNSLWSWAAAAALTLAVFVALALIRRIALKRVRALSERASIDLLHIAHRLIERSSRLVLFVLALYAGSKLLVLPAGAQVVISRVCIVAVILQAGLWSAAAAQAALERYAFRQSNAGEALSAINLISFVLRVVIWTVVGLLILANVGIDITALVAGLGIGGVAIALAVQNILGDLFASLSIVLDRPFEVGDFIIVGDFLGRVETIGIKTTRVRSLSGEQVVFPNADLLNSRIRNFKRMYERRVLFTIGVTYQTSHEELERIPGIIKGIIEAAGNTRFDRAHFKQFGDSALIFEVVYFVLSADFNVYAAIEQRINVSIYKTFTEQGIDFAYPTRTLFLHHQNEAAA